MRQWLALLLALAILPAGCDVFIMDFGEEGMPCIYPEDCEKGLECIGYACAKPTPACNRDEDCHDVTGAEWMCNWENRCYQPQPSAFWVECDWQNPTVCGGDFPACRCFAPGDQDCHCTDDDCHGYDECGGGPSTRRCTAITPNEVTKVCTPPEYNQGIGGLCDAGNHYHCQPQTECIKFNRGDAGDYHFCTRECPGDANDCPDGMECRQPFGQLKPICGYPTWFGFNVDCSSATDMCQNLFEIYPICHNEEFCTKNCVTEEDCPISAHCEPVADQSVCVPNIY